jgi:hypothetical protein
VRAAWLLRQQPLVVDDECAKEDVAELTHD